MKRFLLFSLTVFGVAFAATLFPVQIQAQTVPTQCIADGLTEYMNTVLDGAGSLPNIKLLSPAFNLTNPAEAEIANLMVAGGARFSELDGFAGNTYTLNGVRAMEFLNGQPLSLACTKISWLQPRHHLTFRGSITSTPLTQTQAGIGLSFLQV